MPKLLQNLRPLLRTVSDNILSDVLVLTEGPKDIPVLSILCNWMGIIDRYNIKFWPLGGDIMADLDLSAVGERKNVIALIDSDPGSKVVRTRFERNCKQCGIICHRLERYSIENYFSLKAIREVFGEIIPPEIDQIKPDISVDEQIGFISEGKETKSIKTKNYEIMKKMSLQDFKGTDLYSFCKKIEEICKGQQKWH